MTGEIEVLARAHGLFGAPVPAAPLQPADPAGPPAAAPAGAFAAAYRAAAAGRAGQLAAARGVDVELAAILNAATAEHREGHARTAAVLAAARADTVVPDNPIAAREFLRRRAGRLRAQRELVMAARRRSRRRLAALRRLGYRLRGTRTFGRGGRAEVAVRAALSRIGSPYVWGAAGPDRFDCSGLVQWSYARAGVSLHRTTYDQINDGIPVPLAAVRPGDLVFPHAGHVQMAIGNGLVVEAPHAGASVQISRLGSHIAIRRPV